MQYAVFQGAQTGIGRNAELQTGETDFEDQQKRRKEEEQQPKIGPGDDQRAAGWHQALNERSHDARPIEPTQRPNPDSNWQIPVRPRSAAASRIRRDWTHWQRPFSRSPAQCGRAYSR